MPLPRWLARLNRVGLNHVTRPLAGHAPGFGVVLHKGRTSGREYRTPVNVFRREGGYAIALTYGTDSQWLKNVLAAGEADVVAGGKTHHVVNPRVVEDPERKDVPGAVGRILGLLDVDHFLLVDSPPGADAG